MKLPFTIKPEYSSRKKYGGLRPDGDWLPEVSATDMEEDKPGDGGTGEGVATPLFGFP
jgi:hypothetical protein